MPRNKSGDRILGPYKERGGKLWRVIYCIGGARQSETYATERKARAAIAAARAEVDPAAELWRKAERFRQLAEEFESAASQAEARGMTIGEEIEACNDYQREKGRKERSVIVTKQQLRGVLGPVTGLRPRAITRNRAGQLYRSRAATVAATEGGLSSAAVSRALGHASEKVTREHYTKRESTEAATQGRVLRVLRGGRS